MMGYDYRNLNLSGTLKEQREMVHCQRPFKRGNGISTINNLVGAFFALAIGAMVLSEGTKSLRKAGLV